MHHGYLDVQPCNEHIRGARRGGKGRNALCVQDHIEDAKVIVLWNKRKNTEVESEGFLRGVVGNRMGIIVWLHG